MKSSTIFEREKRKGERKKKSGAGVGGFQKANSEIYETNRNY